MMLAALLICGIAASGVELVDPAGPLGSFGSVVGLGKSVSAPVAIPARAGAVRVRTRMKTDALVPGAENWMDGRLVLRFRGADGKYVGGWLPAVHASGTTGWIPFEREYAVPKGATALYVSESNHGRAGTATFGSVSVALVRERMDKAVNMPVPDGVDGDPEAIDDAWRVETGTRVRICLNGLWRARPAQKGEFPAEGRGNVQTVPGADDAWGWGKIPSVWRKPWDFSSRGQEFLVSRWWAENGVEIDPDRQDAWWYRRTFTMPECAKGRRVLLTFTGVSTRAQVFIDGVRAGEVAFPGGEVDITAMARPGSRQTVAMLATAFPHDGETLDFNAADRVDRMSSVVKLRGVAGDVHLDMAPRGLRIVDAWTETSVRKMEISFFAAVEGAKEGDMFSMSAETAGCGGNTSFHGEATADSKGVIKFSAPWRDAKLWDVHTPGNLYTARVSISRPGSSGAFLDEALPFRFGFREIAVSGRDFLLNGKRIHLRALPCASMTRGADRARKAAALDTCRRMKDMGFNFAVAGNYDLRPGAVSHVDSTLDAFDEAGMLYAFTMPHMKDFGDRFANRRENIGRYRRLAAWAVSRVRNHPSVVAYATSHNAVGYTGDQNPLRLDGTYDPVPDGKASRDDWGVQRRRAASAVEDAIRSLDGTRIVYHHASGTLGGMHTSNMYLNWAPIQERSDWLQGWSEKGVSPLFLCEWGCPHAASWSSYRGPLFIWRRPGFHSLWAQEYAAAFRGDDAYEGGAETRRALALEESLWSDGRPFMFARLRPALSEWESNYQAIAGRYLYDNWRSLRAWGCSAVLPWDSDQFHRRISAPARPRSFGGRYRRLKEPGIVPDELTGGEGWLENGYFYDNGPRADFALTAMGGAISRWNGDDCAFIGGEGAFTDKRHLFRAGERVSKTLVILNDRRERQSIRWKWDVEDGSLGKVSSGSGSVDAAPGGRADVQVSFPASAPGEFRLVATFAFADGVNLRDEFAFTVLPSAAVRPGAPHVLLYDVKGLTRAHFDRLGIGYSLLKEFPEGADAGGRTVVIGRESLSPGVFDAAVRRPNRRPLRTWNEWKGSVLVFEQSEEMLNAIGFRTQTYGLRNAFPRHSAAKSLGLDAELLRDWAGEATLVSPYLDGIDEQETDYARRPWAGFANTRVWRCRSRGSVASVLMEKPSRGDWKALCDGAFDLQYSPLLELSVAGGRVVFCQLDVTGRTVDDPAADDLTRRLVAYANRRADAAPQPLKTFGEKAFFAARDAGFDIDEDPASTGGMAFAASSGAVKPGWMDDRVRAGAKVLCLGFSADEVARWLPAEEKCRLPCSATNACVFSRIENVPPELDGLSNADWAWHGLMDFDAFQTRTDDGNSAIRVLRYGKGSFIFWQMPPWKIDSVARPYLRSSRRRAEAMLSRILGNIGSRNVEAAPGYCDAPVASDDPYRYYRW